MRPQHSTTQRLLLMEEAAQAMPLSVPGEREALDGTACPCRYAVSNTRRGIESCGILAGTLSADDAVFNITTLIVPKQTGTTDTVGLAASPPCRPVPSDTQRGLLTLLRQASCVDRCTAPQHLVSSPGLPRRWRC